MIRNPVNVPRLSSSGWSWPNSGSETDINVRDIFGPRTFSPHIATVGYDYDFHRGADLPIAAGDPVYSTVAGPVTRHNHSHFGWETAAQLNYWGEIDASSAATFTRVAPSTLRIVGSRVGSKTFATAAKYYPLNKWIDISSGDWEMRAKLTSDPTLTGGVVGFGVYDPNNTEYVSIEYDGTTVTARGIQAAGTLSVDGTTSTFTPTFLRIIYTQSTDTITWGYTDDDTGAWTSVTTKTPVVFTHEGFPAFVPVVYWRSTDTNASTQTCDIEAVGWYDNNTIDRFGNLVQITTLNEKVVLMHLQEVSVNIGALVEAGQLIGYAGNTGFDARSGPIINAHVHVEYDTARNFFYTNTESVNPLGVGVLPRVNVSNNVSGTVTTANDPDSVDSHKLAITVTRADQDFDVNQITLTGNTTFRTINFNTRSGLNVDNDVPKQAGVYIVCHAFDENSGSYTLDVYFNKSTVGSTFVSASILDSAGSTLWSG